MDRADTRDFYFLLFILFFYTPSREFELVSASGKVQLSTREAAEDSVVCCCFFWFFFKLLIISVCVVFLFCFLNNRSTLNFCCFVFFVLMHCEAREAVLSAYEVRSCVL